MRSMPREELDVREVSFVVRGGDKSAGVTTRKMAEVGEIDRGRRYRVGRGLKFREVCFRSFCFLSVLPFRFPVCVTSFFWFCLCRIQAFRPLA